MREAWLGRLAASLLGRLGAAASLPIAHCGLAVYYSVKRAGVSQPPPLTAPPLTTYGIIRFRPRAAKPRGN